MQSLLIMQEYLVQSEGVSAAVTVVFFINVTRSNENLSITGTEIKVKTLQASFLPSQTSNPPEVCAHVKLHSTSCHSNLVRLKSCSPVSLYFISRVHVELFREVPGHSLTGSLCLF